MHRRHVPSSAVLAVLALSLLCAAPRAHGQEYWTVQDPLANFSTGFRFGGYVLTDDDARDTYEGLGVFGIDLKYHFFDLPLALSTSFDFLGGDGDPDVTDPDVAVPGIVDADADVQLFNWRLTAVFEPPAGYFGDAYGHFYVNPYVGGGLGLHYAWEEIEREGFFFRTETDESSTSIGFHGLAGIDFVFGTFFSAGLEVLYATSTVDGVVSAHDFDGFMITGSLRFFF